MIKIRPSAERGYKKTTWLESWHSFSFADYYDPKHQNFRSLRVINQDIVQPETGFGMHPHQDMEILTFIIRGSLQHRDSLGNQGLINVGEMQRMTAGSGIIHSEVNPSTTEPVELLQIWIFPSTQGLTPGYQQKSFALQNNSLQLLASSNGEQQSLLIHQDAAVYRGLLEKGQSLRYELSPQRGAWLQLISGELQLNDDLLQKGDGAALEAETLLLISAITDSEFLLFDLA